MYYIMTTVYPCQGNVWLISNLILHFAPTKCQPCAYFSRCIEHLNQCFFSHCIACPAVTWICTPGDSSAPLRDKREMKYWEWSLCSVWIMNKSLDISPLKKKFVPFCYASSVIKVWIYCNKMFFCFGYLKGAQTPVVSFRQHNTNQSVII